MRKIIHYKIKRDYKYVYRCNQCFYANPEKSTIDIKKVNCEQCKLKIKSEGNRDKKIMLVDPRSVVEMENLIEQLTEISQKNKRMFTILLHKRPYNRISSRGYSEECNKWDEELYYLAKILVGHIAKKEEPDKIDKKHKK